MIRLRYKEENGLLVSNEVVADGNLLVVVLNPTTNTFNIVNAAKTHCFTTGKSKSLSGLKIKAKKALVELGASFVAEVRSVGASLELRSIGEDDEAA